MARSSTTLKPGNLLAEKHGASAAEKALEKNTAFTGLAAERLLEVTAEYHEAGGLERLLERNALRLQAASECFWDALQKSMESGEPQKVADYASRFGALAERASKALVELKKSEEARLAAELPDLSVYRR